MPLKYQLFIIELQYYLMKTGQLTLFKWLINLD